MGLKQSIVVRSEYTNNARSAEGKGSRGATPGLYVMRYMAREHATEVLAPVLVDDATYDGAGLMRYMARDTATEQLKAQNDLTLSDMDDYRSPLVLKHKFRSIDKQSGRAFGTRGISLSHETLEASSDAIQQAFDAGHSVQKIIISFTEDYLRETGVLDPSFVHKGRGSYRGQIDQLKLRTALMAGMNRMIKTGRFRDPEWVGTIQLDTSHVHAHIALADKAFAPDRMRSDGADRGKINEREKASFRKGLHYSLSDMKALNGFHQQASLERQNVTAFIKDYAYQTLYQNTELQLLIASLPKDRTVWRYQTNRNSMKYPNELAEKIVRRVFHDHPDESGYARASASVRDYAREAARKNHLTSSETRDVMARGQAQIIERSVNSLYRSIKKLGKAELQTRTTMIDVQSSSDDELARAVLSSGSADQEAFDPAAFALRVRGYNKRQDVHTELAESFYELATEYDQASDDGLVDSTALVMRLFYEEEQEYHMGLADKYRTFLSFYHPKDREHVTAFMPAYDELSARYRTIRASEQQTGTPLPAERKTYTRDLREYTFRCFSVGAASLKEWQAVTDFDRDQGTVKTKFVLPIRPKLRTENLTPEHFQQVKAWDVHHLGLDYYNRADARIDAVNAEAFANVHAERAIRATDARAYLDVTAQDLPIVRQAERDIADMEPVVEKAERDGLIQTVSSDDLAPESERQRYTISPDHVIDTTEQMRRSLNTQQIIQQIERDELE